MTVQRNLTWLAVGMLIGGVVLIATLKVKAARDDEDFEALADKLSDKLDDLEASYGAPETA